MNATMVDYAGHDFLYSLKIRRNEGPRRPKQAASPRYSRRRGKSPLSFNGIHRRRTKKILW